MGDTNIPDYSAADTSLVPGHVLFTNGSDSEDELAESAPVLVVPETVKDVSKLPNRETPHNVAHLLSLLEAAGQEMGVNITERMRQVVTAMSITRTVDVDSMIWFVSGYQYANNTELIPQMHGIVKDLQTEIRQIQEATNGISQVTRDFTGKMANIKNDILKQFTKLSDTINTSFTGMIGKLSNYKEMITTGKGKSIDLGDSSKTPITSPPPSTVSLPEKLLNASTVAAMKTTHADTVLLETKRSILSLCGWPIMAGCDKEVIDMIVPDEFVKFYVKGGSIAENAMIMTMILEKTVNEGIDDTLM